MECVRRMVATMNANSLTGMAAALVAAIVVFWPAGESRAATVDLAQIPLVSGVSTAVPPNIDFVLDDSGSMAWEFIGDTTFHYAKNACFKNFGGNPLYYNPNVTYSPPIKADGTSYPNGWASSGSVPSGCSALGPQCVKQDGYDPTPSYVDLSKNFSAWATNSLQTLAYGCSGSNCPSNGSSSNDGSDSTAYSVCTGTTTQCSGYNASNYTIYPAYYYTYTGSSGSAGQAYSATNPPSPCGTYNGSSFSDNSYATTNGNFAIHVWSGTGTTHSPATYTVMTLQDQQNFANWYAYYRTRINTLKSSAGQAFQSISNKYNVGYDNIHNSSDLLVPMAPFTGTSKSNWYSQLYSASASGGTPSRASIAKAGQVFAHTYKGTGSSVVSSDPVQYSCQQNFMILATDGYWNSSEEQNLFRSSVSVPPNVDNSATVGNADSCTIPSTGFSDVRGCAGTSTNNTYAVVPNSTGGQSTHPYTDLAGTTSPTTTQRTDYSNTMADVAMYYWATPLRTAAIGNCTSGANGYNVCGNNVPVSSTDPANWPHMNFYAIGLGAAGNVPYCTNYWTGASCNPTGYSTTYSTILQGTTPWPDPQASSSTNQLQTRADDLWHAAINGHGRYFSAASATQMSSALSQTLASISAQQGSAAAAATSNLQPVSGDNYAFVAQFTTAQWVGDINAYTINPNTGAVSTSSIWTAQSQIQSQVSASSDSRNIYFFNSSGTNNLSSFADANMTSYTNSNLAGTFGASGTNLVTGVFNATYSNAGSTPAITALTQIASVPWSTTQTNCANGTTCTPDPLIGYLRGQNGNEEQTGNAIQLFRDRVASFGDIVNSAPIYVRSPQFSYSDSGYATFITNQASRVPTLYVGANDGMLHAIDASVNYSCVGSPPTCTYAATTTSGQERWAFIPSPGLPYMRQLADDTYPNNHRFFVDGPVVVGDAYDGSNWRTVLVGGLGDGGQEYYALDVTNPTSPKALWEISSATTGFSSLGYTYGNPVITKRNGTWVAIFASGYNNSTGSDPRGRIFVVNLITGAKISEIVASAGASTGCPAISTSAGSGNDPNQTGIARIANWVSNPNTDNTTQYVYAGDLNGNLWRFDINAGTSQRLGCTSTTVGNQPIQVRPELGQVGTGGSAQRIIIFGTGRYLGLSDIGSTSTSQTVAQAIYAVKDTGTDLGVLTGSGAALVQQTLNSTASPRTITASAINWATQNGWYVRTPVGERFNIDPNLQLGTLVIGSNSPNTSTSCTVGGTSYLYSLSYSTGGAVGIPAGQVGQVGTALSAQNSLLVGVSLVKLASNKLVAIATYANTSTLGVSVPVNLSSGTLRRIGWRELN